MSVNHGEASTSTDAVPTRPLILQTGANRVSIPVSTTTNVWIAAEVLRDAFLHSVQGEDFPTDDDTSALAYFAKFLGFLASNINTSAAHTTVLHSSLAQFTSAHLSNLDVHTLVASLDLDTRKQILSGYFTALAALESRVPATEVPRSPPSALFTAAKSGQASIYGLFGGQGTNEVYFDELKALFDIYGPYVTDLIAVVTKNVLQPAAEKATLDGFTYYAHGLDVLGWLNGSVTLPPLEYLASVPISFPLIGLTQLVQYLVTARVSNLSPGELRSIIQGATGHSQGMVSAVAIAASTTSDSYTVNVSKAAKWLFYMGLRGQDVFPVLAVEPKIVQDAVEGGEGTPTPMLAVSGLTLKALKGHIDSTNSHLPTNSKLFVSLNNGPKNFVVTGPSRALYGLVTALRKIRAPAGLDQSKVPFSQRKTVFSTRFLLVNVPYHSDYLIGATEKVLDIDLAGEELWSPSELQIPVYNTEDGSDLRSLRSSLTRSLCDQVFTLPIFWSRATNFPETATHALDFGPGGLSGIGPLTSRNLEGRGVRVIILGEKGKGGAEVYDAKSVRYEDWWSKKWTPGLVKTHDGRIQIDTPFSRLLGKPPIMVAGMTPSTVKAGFVSAILSAGFHVELAGGGHYNAAAVRAKVAEIQAQIPAGVGLTLNSLYINPRQFGFQFPLWQEMKREGLPIEGFCVAAGIPSTEKAAEIIGALRNAGIKHVAFKPGSVDGIRQVVAIAAANPDFPIILQWTGGRAGGHHSYEDFHQPILLTYGAIRQHPNISLVAGSGFGDGDETWPYITGDWSVNDYGVQAMPFDGILFASWVMVAKEAHTSESVKQLIVQAAGVSDDKWEGTYKAETGGVLTVSSELGEPIHKVATRGVRLWKEFEDSVFKLPKDKRVAWLAQNADSVISKLNKDFAKPWFAQKKDGTPVKDLGDLTYEETVLRLVRLMFVAHQTRWVDVSLRNLLGDWLRRVEERFAGVNGKSKTSILQSYSALDDPAKFLETFFKTYPGACDQLLAAEDKAYFLSIAQRPGQKPVPFIPILDANFEVWFKKDSLWYAEDVDAVFDQDPQRVCILQGPVAARHSKVANRPIKDMLSGVESALIKKLLDRYYGGDEANVPYIDYIGASPSKVDTRLASTYGINVTVANDNVVYTLGPTLPPTEDWLETLSGASVTWLRALLRSTNIVHGGGYQANPLKRLFAPRAHQRVSISYDAGAPTSISIVGAARSFGLHKPTFEAVSVKFDRASNIIAVTIYEDRTDTSVPLSFVFQYRPEQGFAPIHEIVEGRNKRIKEFYWKLWFGDNQVLPNIDIRDTFVGPEVTIDAATVERFCSVIGNQGELFKRARNAEVEAPMDFAIVTGWQAIMRAIFPDLIDGDLLKLVHLSNGFRAINSARPLKAGDVCRTEARIVSVINSDIGKTVKVKGNVLRGSEPVIEVNSSFLYRGRFTDYDNTFEIVDEPEYIVSLVDAAAVGVLQSKEWFDWGNDAQPLLPGTHLVFHMQSELVYKDKSTFSSIAVTGRVFVRDQLKTLIPVATVDYSNGISVGNPVVAYLQRHGQVQGKPALFESLYSLTTTSVPSTFIAPATNEPYSKVSGDFNPIHINPYFSDYASLPGTITHGMWSSAATRKYVETIVAQGKPSRVLSYDVDFVGMVLPGDEVSVKLSHIGMKDGNLVVKVETTNQRGDKIIQGTAEVAQPPTVYVFTGQGSQEPGMGMDLYGSSPAARAVWDGADEHLLAVYGFSIIELVKHNPKEKTIHFGGIKGQAIRQRYIDMTYDTMDKDGNVKTLPLFADINNRTPKYTFSHPGGLLFATQFAQIALVVTEKAAFDDMRSKGLVQPNCAFAGHSLGEYSALASIADVLPVSSLVDVVFYRGITMQRAVERDAHNRSNYAMCAVNPSRISKTFNEAALREVVEVIARRSNVLLEIVNYNVEGSQYVCAGDLLALQSLTNVLNYLKKENIDIQKLTKTFSVDRVKEMLQEIVDNCITAARQKQEADDGYIVLERGFATIPLPGIDVPFHSRYLWAGVMPFRAYLSKKINSAHLNPDLLVGKYIPNLIAKPFEISREYAQIIYDQTSSPRLDKVLKNWERDNWTSPEQRQNLAYTILVELLAYQFASPVRWIETQDLLFSQYHFERLIELGPGPTLTGMATRTLKAKYEASDDSVSRTRVIYCHAKNTKEIYYQFEDEAVASDADAVADSPATTAAPASVVVATPVAAPASSSGPVASIADEPLKALDTLRVIIAQKLKKKVEEIPLSKSIKDLVGGKSTLQNEILGDLNLEFVSAPDKGEELLLDELGSSLSTGYSGALGKHTTGLISRLIGGKMPGGFNLSAIKAYLTKTWGLGPSRSDGVLLLGLTVEPPKRLGSEAEAKTWLDTVVVAYAQQAGISLSSGATSGGGGGSGGAVINSEEFIKFQAEQHEFARRQVELYMRYLDLDPREGARTANNEKGNVQALQDKLDAINREHGDAYINGIQPAFEPLKARHFDSSWNWVRQDALIMWYDILHGRISTVDREITARCIAIINRADESLLEYMQYYVDRCDPGRGETYRLGKEFGQQLINNCREALGQPPLYKDVTFPTAPRTEVTPAGDVVYTEVVRENVRKLEAYVEEMAMGGAVPGTVNIQKVQDDVLKLWNVVKSQPEISQEQKNRIKALYDGVVRSLKKSPSEARSRASHRTRRSSSQFLRPQISTPPTALSEDRIPLLHLKRKAGTNWEYSSNLTSVYLDVLNEIATSGTTFKDKNALLTGVGKGSIGVEVVKGLLSGGAHVVITTSRYSRESVEYYQGIFQAFGSRGSALTVVPFNQGSKQDVDALVNYIYSTLNLDLDYILPFAAIPENGREIDGIDDKSELAHRVMLVNLLRLLGAVKTKKASHNFVTRPTQVILPLSPNHGTFGNDGLYSESKISLETLFSRWSSESWGEYLGLAGAVIGWTRGTGLMSATNTLAEHIEAHGARTFSAKEMAFNILGLMHPLLFSITQVEPIWADLNGGMDRIPDLADVMTKVRLEMNAESTLRRSITRDNAADFQVTNGSEAENVMRSVPVTPRANFKFDFPNLESPESLADLAHLQGLFDLDKVLVITGFAEVGPWGSSRTRWEMEARGEFTIEGCIEMAWIMGYIKHFDGKLKNGNLYVGWVDAKTSEPVDDKDVKPRYEREILAHSGIRLIEPELFKGYDPKRKGFNQEVELTHDLEAMEVSEEEAQKFKLQHGDKCDAWAQASGEWCVRFKKGARILVPKAVSFNRLVAGQLPTGWDAGRYGIPPEIVSQTDRTALWALVCTAEALAMAGFTDPYELYKYVHPSEVGTSLGSGMGGMESLSAMFRDRRDEKDVQKDILQETFINSVAGWVNLLLLSSSGPIKIPVGACATALQSLEIACDTILSGKAKVMIAGGYDDFSEEGSFEFANMGATSNSLTEFAMGREPNEHSRPTSSTRDGFLEAQGCGVQVIMSAKTALEMGVAIRGIVAFTSTSSDKAGRSIPAPGKGVLTIGRQVPSKADLPILDVAYRSRQLAFRRKQIAQWIENEHDLLKHELALQPARSEEFLRERVAMIESEAVRQEKDALATFGMLEGQDPRVAPVRRALAVWGLTADDIGVVSIHGTSTQANEKNETSVYNDVFTSIQRTPGNAVPVMAQKSLTGHPKGGAAAWMLAGLCQSVVTGIVPGNRNADNVDSRLKQHEHLLFPSKTIHTDGIKAGIMTSFGFGQVGGVALILHPRFLFGALEPSLYASYRRANRDRAVLSYKAMSEMMIANNLVRIKEHPPYSAELEVPVLLNSLARATLDKTGNYSFPSKLPTLPSVDLTNLAIATRALAESSTAGIGVDQELISSVPSWNSTFVSRNYTDAEVAYCRTQPNAPASFAGRWVGKEAVFKSLGVASKGAAASLKDIEILPDESGVPQVTLHGDALSAAKTRGISKVLLSLSHSDTIAIAFAQAS